MPEDLPRIFLHVDGRPTVWYAEHDIIEGDGGKYVVLRYNRDPEGKDFVRVRMPLDDERGSWSGEGRAVRYNLDEEKIEVVGPTEDFLELLKRAEQI